MTLQQSATTPRRDDVVVVSAADDGYAMPLAVTIRSALSCFDPSRRMTLFVLDGGLSDETKLRLLRSWNDSRLTVHWVRPDMSQVRDLLVSHHVNVVTYLRILMPFVLPETTTRAIYLDADLIVRRDLGALWDEEQGGYAALAVQDVSAPCFDAPLALPTFERCREHLTAFTPIANYRELGLAADDLYLNGGLLVVDLVQWRRERFAEQMLQCLRTHEQHVLWWDQYALNVVLARRWRPLDPRWNQGAHVFAYPNWRKSPYDRDTLRQLKKTPWIVHFCSPDKPWNYFCRHPFTREFRRCLRQTDWRNWRSTPPERLLSKWWDFHYRPLRNEWKTQVRAVKRAIRGDRRKAA